MKQCGACKWFDPEFSECHFPVPIWICRELLNPLTGGGELAMQVDPEHKHNCPTYEVLS